MVEQPAHTRYVASSILASATDDRSTGSMLPQRVATLIRQYAIFAPGDRVLVAVSGGPDSLALLAILHELAPTFSLALSVAHFDHGWREDSPDDAQFVTAIAGRWGYQTTVARATPGTRHTEDAARAARYAFLRETTSTTGSTVIALGHTQDDQVETLLLHLLRGSGTHGLAAMLPRAGDLARPLLSIPRTQIEDYLRANGLTPRVDTTNADLRYTRNRLRRLVLPALQAFDPAFRSRLARAADILAQEDRFLEQETERRFDPDLLRHRADVTAQPLAMQRRLLRRLLPDLSYQHVEALRALITSGRAGQMLALPANRRAHVVSEGVHIRPLQSSPPPLPRLRVRTCDCDPATFKARDAVGHLDAARIVPPLIVSRRVAGDRLQPLGFDHVKKLQDVLVDAHIARHLRDSLPVVRDAEGIVWIAGVTVAETKRVTPQTRQQLHLELTDD